MYPHHDDLPSQACRAYRDTKPYFSVCFKLIYPDTEHGPIEDL